MNKEYYIESIEKTASIKEKAIKMFNKNKGLIKKVGIGTGVGAGALGSAYALSNDEGKAKIKSGVKTVGKSIATGMVNGEAQDTAMKIGGIAGTALAMKKGKMPFNKALVHGGMAGMAIGDIAGGATIPTYQLYKKHKEEFGTAPDAKSIAATIGASTAPVAALWGGLYGLKKGKAIRGEIGKNLEQSLGRVGASGKIFARDFKDLSNKATTVDAASNPEFQKMVSKKMGDNSVRVAKRALKVGAALAPMAAAQEVAALPTYFATPENIVNFKKHRLKKQQEQQE